MRRALIEVRGSPFYLRPLDRGAFVDCPASTFLVSFTDRLRASTWHKELS